MPTVSIYDHTAKLFANGEVTLANLDVMLLGSGYTQADDHSSMGDINPLANEVHGNGWTQGGEDLPSPAITTVTTNDARLDAGQISVTASGGAIGPAVGAVLYENNGSDATNIPLLYITFDSASTASDGSPFQISWSNGVIQWTVV